MSASPGSVTVVGCGLAGARHLTLETVETIRAADVVYHLVTGDEAVAAFAALNPQTYGLIGFYRDGALDLDVYAQIVSFVIAQALVPRRVVLVVMGHPSIYVAPTHMLQEHGPRYGVPVSVLPAISSIDVMLTDFPFDIANTGLQILDANRLVTYRLRPQRNVPLLLFQVGCFGSGIITRTQQNHPGRLSALADYLLGFYGAAHEVVLIEGGMGFPHRPVRHRMPLAELATNGHLVTYNTTLYVPAEERVAVRDAEFLARLTDPHAAAELVAAAR